MIINVCCFKIILIMEGIVRIIYGNVLVMYIGNTFCFLWRLEERVSFFDCKDFYILDKIIIWVLILRNVYGRC